MVLRTTRDRAIQTFGFEATALLLAVPAYGAAFGAERADGATLLVSITLVCLVWSPIHNMAWDFAEWRLARRISSDRPHRLRLLHALSLETTAVVLTLPLIMALGGHGLAEALTVNLSLTLGYVAWGWAYYWAYDQLWPVRPFAARP